MPLDEKNRRFFVLLAVVLLGATIGLGFLIIPDYIRLVKPSNIRFDETSQGQFYSQILVDSSNPIDDLLVVHSKVFNNDIVITVYNVSETVDVLALIEASGIKFDAFCYSVYGIVYKNVNILEKIYYRFLFQASLYNTDSWYLSREVIPIDDNASFYQANEGITVIEILDKIDDILNVPFT